jgi:hypothetical protein
VCTFCASAVSDRECRMESPAKKRTPSESTILKRAEPPPPTAQDEDLEDLEVFRSMQQISLRASAKELEKLIGPA